MESGDEDDAFTMGEREWQKMNRDLSKHGYRDGKNEGREQGRQKAFEEGTKLGLQRADQLGQLLGVIEWKLIHKSNLPPSNLTDKPENQMKLKELQNTIMKYLENLKNEERRFHIENCEKYKKIIEVLKQNYLSMYQSEEHFITKILGT